MCRGRLGRALCAADFLVISTYLRPACTALSLIRAQPLLSAFERETRPRAGSSGGGLLACGGLFFFLSLCVGVGGFFWAIDVGMPAARGGALGECAGV